MLLKLKAKVLLADEEQMETEEKYDLGSIAKSKEWVWRMIAVPVEEVYKVIEFNKSKTIVQTYDDEKILVAEPFEEVFKKWDALKQFDPLPDGDQEEQEESQEENED